MLSDKGIRDYLQKGLLGVEPLGGVGPASIDLHIDNRLYRSNSQAWNLHNQEVNRLAQSGDGYTMQEKLEEPGLLPFDEFVSRFALPVSKTDGHWILQPNQIYYIQTSEAVKTKKGVRVGINARSSAARNGLHVQFSDNKLDHAGEFSDRVPLVLRTYGTNVELPENYSVLQLVVEPSRHLMDYEIERAVSKGEITVSGKPEIRDDSIYLTFHPTILRYNGRAMNPTKDSKECFDPIDITHNYVLEPGTFYLASTEEIVTLGSKHVGVLDEKFNFADVHMNAPFH